MDVQIITLSINTVLPFLLGVGGSYIVIFKPKISQFRKFIDNFAVMVDDVDNAMVDEKVSETEAQKIWADAKSSWDNFTTFISK